MLEVFSGTVLQRGTGEFVTFGHGGRCYVSAALARHLDSSCSEVLVGYDAELETLYLWSVPAGDRRAGTRLAARWRAGKVTVRAYPALRYWSLCERATGPRPAIFAHGRIEIDLREPSLKGKNPTNTESAPQRHGGHREETAVTTPPPAASEVVTPEPRVTGHESPPLASTDLIGVAEVCEIAGNSVRGVAYLRKRGKFPEPVAKRGPANLWRRGDIVAWVAARTEPPVEAGVELLDIHAVAAMVGYTQATLYNRISRKLFPAHTQSRGIKHFWTKAAVEQWLATHKSGESAPVAKVNGPHAAGGSGDKRTPPATDQPKTCATCADNKGLGKHCFCRSQVEENPNRNTMIEPTHGCEHHRKPSSYRPVRMDEED